MKLEDINHIQHDDAILYGWENYNEENVIMFGDFHGAYHTFFRHMKRFEFQGIITWKNNIPTIRNGYKLLFLGDILDRGAYSLEILLYICLLIIHNKNKIIFNRGNHEEYSKYRGDFIIDELKNKLKKMNEEDINNIKTLIKNILTLSPSAVILYFPNGKKIWACHGGIPFEFVDNNSVKIIDINIPDKGIYTHIKTSTYDKNSISKQIKWNDLHTNKTANKSLRGDTLQINNIHLKQILRGYNIDFLIRGHQDSYGNTVLFTKHDENANYNIDNDTGYYENGESIHNYIPEGPKEGAIATIRIKKDDFTGEILDKQTKNKNATDFQAITISTNTAFEKPLTRDSYIIVSCILTEEEIAQAQAQAQALKNKNILFI